jgi:hypothetical protein
MPRPKPSDLLLLAFLVSACSLISPEDYEERLDEDKDGVPMSEDCDDQDATVQTRSWYVDEDDDGFGTEEKVVACVQPEFTATNSDDCNDHDSSISPAGTELCDEIDSDCNGKVDDNAQDTHLLYRDFNGDDFGDAEIWMEACDESLGWV